MKHNKEDIKLRVIELLKKIFQFESEDLDFGIYKIMNFKKKEIENFINKQLIEEVKNQLKLLTEEEKTKKKKELEKLKREIIENFGEDAFKNGELKDEFKNTPKGKEYTKKLEEIKRIKFSEETEKDIYNHIINFFSRYYDKGDFISKRRYGKNEKYVIPYNGEEVLLYWANKDQYYVKTTEWFKKYVFKVKGLTVNFRIIEAEQEVGNVKAQEKKFFVLNERIFDLEENELNIYFEFRALTDEEKKKFGERVKQDDLNKHIFEVLKKKLEKNNKAKALFEKENDKTILEKHLFRYTRRNTSDYFIHRDLKRFFKRELDFYIKNEVLNLENLDNVNEENLAQNLLKAKVIRKISEKIIEFLAQIEDFQKKLWEKKKFVIKTDYVITLDKIKEYAGEEFLESILDEILKNEKQLEEWKELFGIEVKRKEDLILDNNLHGKEWKKLPIDTTYFDEEFKWKLLIALSENLPNNKGIDEILDGILIKSENWQALNLLLNKYYEKVQTIYIDPPFNKEQEADYLYKVGYKDATWITMLENRIRLGRDLLNEKGSIFVRCDYNGNMYVRMLLNEIFGWENFRNEIILKRTAGLPKREFLNMEIETEYLIYYARNHRNLLFNQLWEDREPKWMPVMIKYNRGGPTGKPIVIEGKVYNPPEGYSWAIGGEVAERIYREGRLKIEKGKPFVLIDKKTVGSNWTDIPGYVSPPRWGFSTENHEKLLKRAIKTSSNEGDLILDFFLGSGTTTAVAHKLKRKWIGIEMGEHFWTVVLPRIKKVLFYDKSGISKEKDVKEKYNPKTAGGFFKYHTLEQYEDSLENIEFEQKTLLEFEDYFVKYMLDFETKKSKTFLNIDEMKDPFNYKLKIIENYQIKVITVDLVETFNYLLGLEVKKIKVMDKNRRRYVFVFGEVNGQSILVVWRSIKDIDWKKDRDLIENIKKELNPDETYINGDSVVRGFKQIESEFKALLWG